MQTSLQYIIYIDYEGTLHRLNGDPRFPIVPRGLESTHLLVVN